MELVLDVSVAAGPVVTGGDEAGNEDAGHAGQCYADVAGEGTGIGAEIGVEHGPEQGTEGNHGNEGQFLVLGGPLFGGGGAVAGTPAPSVFRATVGGARPDAGPMV